MATDGLDIPDFLKISPEERAKAWEGVVVTYASRYGPPASRPKPIGDPDDVGRPDTEHGGTR